jgi:LysR family cys regulon transcriptional activator
MTWIGYRHDTVLRRYMLEFIHLFTSHLSRKQIDAVQRATNQARIDEIFQDIEIPMRGGCTDEVIASA